MFKFIQKCQKKKEECSKAFPKIMKHRGTGTVGLFSNSRDFTCLKSCGNTGLGRRGTTYDLLEWEDYNEEVVLKNC